MRIPRWSIGLVLLVAACGGGGAAAPEDPPVMVVDLGVLSSTTDSTSDVFVSNPFTEAATVWLLEDTAHFTVAAPVLPLVVPANAVVDLSVLFRPNDAGTETGTIRIGFTAGDTTLTQEVQLTARGEAVQIQVLTPAVAFGEVLPDTSKDEQIDVQNLSTKSRAIIRATDISAEFELLTPVPLFIEAGATESLTVRYAPTVPGAPTGFVRLESEDPNGPIDIPLSATTGGQEIVDFGTLTLDTAAANADFTARTDARTFDVPADAISFTVEAYTDSGTRIALAELTGPNGENFEDENFQGFYLQYPDAGEFAAPVPNTDKAGQQIIPGTWTMRIGRLSGGDTNVEVRVVIERRPGNTGHVATLDLNVFLADALSVDAASAPTDTVMQDIWSRVNTLLSQQGIQIGEITYYDLTDTAYDDVTGAEFPTLLAESGNATEERFNYFFVRTALGGGILGVSAKLGGTTKKGTPTSGVMGLWIDNPTPQQADLVARVTAHEMGHYLGLRHTAESSGANDDIDDTANHGSGGNGQYLMHWSASSGGSEISNGQGLVIRGHPHMKAALPPPAPLQTKPVPASPRLDILAPQNWCGTCQRCKDKYELLRGR